jgi:glycosyltransferase involved in cell wall biosynthesis
VLVPVRDAQALAAALRPLIDSAPLRAAMGRAGRAMAQADFSEQRVVAETLAIYQELLPLRIDADRQAAQPVPRQG